MSVKILVVDDGRTSETLNPYAEVPSTIGGWRGVNVRPRVGQ